MDNKSAWEQSEVPKDIPVYNVEFPITGRELCLHVRGDQHIGLKCVSVKDIVEHMLKEQNKHKNSMFVIDTGDLIENGLKDSVGHNYDIGIPDPEDQIKLALEMQKTLDENLYGIQVYKRLSRVTREKCKHTRRIGVIGNHEYRSRKKTGLWLNSRLYGSKGVLDGGVHCILNLKITNKKLKLSRTYRIYVAHRLTNTSAGISIETMIRNFRKKKSDINADIYVCGHYHRRFIQPDYKYYDNGKKYKVLYVSNPSPAETTEYGLWGLYSPIGPGYHTNIYLPIDPHEHPWGKV